MNGSRKFCNAGTASVCVGRLVGRHPSVAWASTGQKEGQFQMDSEGQLGALDRRGKLEVFLEHRAGPGTSLSLCLCFSWSSGRLANT